MINVVLIGGGFSFYSTTNLLQYFKIDNDDPDLNIIELYPPPFASVHDTACYTFYQLKGGTTFFGVDHAKKYDHNLYCKTYDDPLLKNWDENNPIHILGHSQGGLTGDYLLKLLDMGFFPEHKTSKNWIKSITFFCTPFRGSINGMIGNFVVNIPIIKQISFLYAYTGFFDNLFPLNIHQWNIKKSQTKSIYHAYRNFIKHNNSDDISYSKYSYKELLSPNNLVLYENTYYFVIYSQSMYLRKIFNFFSVYIPYDTFRFTLNPFRMFIRLWSYVVAITTYLFYVVNNNNINIDDIFTNDGVVTKYSTKPFGVSMKNISMTQTPIEKIKKGQIYKIKSYSNMSHIDALGFFEHNDQNLFDDYFKFIKRLETKIL